MVNKGDRVKDRITGFTGIVWGVTDYLEGCRRLHVMPEKLKDDGSVPDLGVFDEPQVEVLEKGAYKIRESKAKKPGGPAYLNAQKPGLGAK